MRTLKLIKAGTFILLIIIFCGCNTRKNGAEKSGFSGDPQLKFEFTKELHNFGTLQSGEVATGYFRLVNTGNTNFNVERIKTNCGCVTVVFPPEAIAPGDTTYLEVAFDSSGETGRIYQEIKVTIKGSELTEKSLAIVADVKNKLFNYK
jgi:Protein of unknown function (DUF1573).